MGLTKIQLVFIDYILAIILTGLLCSCGHSVEYQNEQFLKKAEQLTESAPEEALILLDSIQLTPQKRLLFARYSALKVRARHKAGLDISSDTVIFRVRDYLVKERDKYAALACLTSAGVYETQNNMAKALHDYLLASGMAKDLHDDLLKGTIYYNLARIYYNQQLYSESLDYIKKSKKYEDLAGVTDESQAYTLLLTGINYLYLSKNDSARIYLDRILSMKDLGDYLLKDVYLAISEVNYRDHNYDAAKRMCQQTLSLIQPADSLTAGRLYLIFAGVYNKTDQPDSASLYVYKAKTLLEHSIRNLDLVDMYLQLSLVEEKNLHLEKASYYQQLYKTHLELQEHVSAAILREQIKYHDYTIHTMQEEQDQLILQRKLYIALLLNFILVMFIGIYFFIRYRRKNKLKQEEQQRLYRKEVLGLRHTINHEKLKIIFHVNDLAELNNMMYEYDTDKVVRREISEMLRKLSWEALYPVFNDIYDGLLDRIKKDFPALTTVEYQTCCLTYVGFGALAISAIIGERFCTSQNRQTEIRKKLGIKSRGSIIEFLDVKYGIDSSLYHR